MNHVYLVHHIHEVDDEEDVKFIGCYSTKEKAEAAVMRLKSMVGFSGQPDNFSVERYQLDEDHWTEGFVTVYPEKD